MGGQKQQAGEQKTKLHKGKTARLLKLMDKALLRNMQGTRDLLSRVVVVLLAEDYTVEFIKMKEQTERYSELDQAGMDKQGPPHLAAFMGLMEGSNSRGTAVVQANYTASDAHQEKITVMEWEELAEEVGMCKLVKTFKEGQKKLIFEVSRTPTRKELILALRQLDHGHKQGRPPPTFMERELADWLSCL